LTLAVIRSLENGAVATEMGCKGQKWALENFTQEALSRALEGFLRLAGHVQAPCCTSVISTKGNA
jgi:hypothetical protein